MNKSVAIVIVSVFAISFFVLIKGSDDDGLYTTSQNSNSASLPAEADYKIGDTVVDKGRYSMTVSTPDCSQETLSLDKAFAGKTSADSTRGKFCLVDITFSSLLSDDSFLDSSLFNYTKTPIEDGNQAIENTDPLKTAEYNRTINTGTTIIERGETKKFTLVYDVSKDFEPATINLPYTDLSSGSSQFFRVALQP